MAWSDAARKAAAEARKRRGAGTRFASRVSQNLGGPKVVVASRKEVSSKAKRDKMVRIMRMNLSPGGYVQAMYEARARAAGLPYYKPKLGR